MNPLILCEPLSAASDVLGRLRLCLPARLRSISPETPIASLELDSLDRVEFLCALDTEFNASFTLEEFEAIKTPGELVTLIQRKPHPPI
jgi:acyl carrier protein